MEEGGGEAAFLSIKLILLIYLIPTYPLYGSPICTNKQVGTSGGQAYLRGDPFGTHCLYNASKVFYASPTVHPPQIGWALDGYSIYGRHISSSNLGRRAIDGYIFGVGSPLLYSAYPTLTQIQDLSSCIITLL